MKTSVIISEAGLPSPAKAHSPDSGNGADKVSSPDGAAAHRHAGPEASPLAAHGHGDALAELQGRYDALVRDQLQMMQERNALVRQLAAVPRAGRDSAEHVAEMEQVLLSIRQARDLLLTRNHELIAELARADDKIAELGYDNEMAIAARDAALKERDERTTECEELRRRSVELEGQMSALVETGARYSTDLASARQTIAELTKELEETHALSDERNRQLDELRSQLQDRAVKAPVSAPAVDGPESRIFKQRREAAILAEQFAAALRERDVARGNAEKIRAAQEQAATERDKLRTELALVRASTEKQIASLRAQLAADQAAAPAPPVAPVALAPRVVVPAAPAESTGTAAEALDSLEECLRLLAEHPDNLNLLDALDSQLRTLSDHAHAAGFGAALRYTVACRELARWLHKAPAKIPSVLPTLHQAFGLLCTLITRADGETAPADPAGALVYSVDDDLDNCECIAAALEKATLITKYATKPEIALSELAVIPCELIILDVNMPGMDGFEVCARIRSMEHHKRTPILFVSGLMSTRERLKTIDCENIEFFPKPYSLAELSVKALSLIISGAL